MKAGRTRVFQLALELVGLPTALWRDRRGNVNVLLGLMLIPLLGAFAMAVEVSGWYSVKRDAQNAADSAALAASTNGDILGSGGDCSSKPGAYDCEAKAAAAKFGFVNGQNNATVAAAYLTSGCPASLNACYQVTVTKKIPLSLAGVVGFHGSTSIGSHAAEGVQASAWARPHGGGRTYCILALISGDGTGLNAAQIATNGITAKGNSNSLPTGCYTFSDGADSCTGAGNHAVADYADTVYGTADTNCAAIAATGGAASVSDENYRTVATTTSIPLSGYSTGTHNISGTLTIPASPGYLAYSGNVKLTGDVTVSGGGQIFIQNGTLDLAGFSMSAPGVTIVFTGTAGGGVNPYPTASKNGTNILDIAAPTSGTWAGIALYQDPRSTYGPPAGSNTDITYNGGGNSPTWKITGLVYAPNSNIVLKGSIFQSTAGAQCVVFVAKTFQLNGSGSIYASPLTGCHTAGLSPPTGTVGATTTALAQ